MAVAVTGNQPLARNRNLDKRIITQPFADHMSLFVNQVGIFPDDLYVQLCIGTDKFADGHQHLVRIFALFGQNGRVGRHSVYRKILVQTFDRVQVCIVNNQFHNSLPV